MGKKRKAGGQYGQSSSAVVAAAANDSDSAKLAIDTYQDVADSEDDFHINRDKILLDEGPAAKRLRKWKEADKFLEQSDEEVLDHRGLDDDDDDDDDDEEEIEEDNEGADDNDVTGRHDDVEDEDADGWGPSKKDYYNADAIETEQDALEEEAEARRIQKKQLLAMSGADYGFDEDEWLDRDGHQSADTGVVSEVLPKWHITTDLPDVEKLKILRSRYPEFEHLSSEFLRLQPLHDELAAAAKASARLIEARVARPGGASRSSLPIPLAVVKYRACASYLAAMSMYFAILGSTANDTSPSVTAMDPTELHDHPIMESLLKCQQLWTKAESLPVADPMVEASYGDDLSVIDELSPGSEPNHSSVFKAERTKLKKTKSERAAEAAKARSEARRAEKLRQAEEELASLATLTDPTTRIAARRKNPKKVEQSKLNLLNPEDSDFGEETELTAHELAEKARKKKSLRFYTSQITQKANKRDAAGKDYGGDADIPHRERLKDRQARLQMQAEKKGQNANEGPGAPLGEDSDSSDNKDREAHSNEFEDVDGYYDMVAARSTVKKQSKLDRAAAYALAAKEGGVVVPEEIVGDDGRRQITYAIEKNKGLTPHRKKSVRNPRVKKKLAFEAKKKKLKSMRPVFDAGKRASGAAAYGGELTGIKKGLVRSRKL